MKTCNTELTELQKMRKWLPLYLAIAASDMKQLGDDELSEMLYETSKAYELAMRP